MSSSSSSTNTSLARAREFAGQWKLDLEKSDPLTPMLEALKVNPAFRKAALALQVTQDITLEEGNVFKIRNESKFGVSLATQLLNAGDQAHADAKTGDLSTYNATCNDSSEYPITVRCELANGKGFTVDRRRIVEGGREMEHILEFKSSPNATPVIMRRYWTRVGAVPQQASTAAKVVAEEDAPKKEEEGAKAVQQPVVVDAVTEEDWPMLALLLSFASVAWMNFAVIDALVWSSALTFARLAPSDFAALIKDRESAASLPLILFFFTRMWFAAAAEHNAFASRALAFLVSLAALAWTQRERLLQGSFAPSPPVTSLAIATRYWLEICAVLVACTLIATRPGWGGASGSGGASLDVFQVVPCVALYALARSRLEVAFDQALVAEQATTPVVEPARAVKPSLAISVSKSRVSSRALVPAPFAQYLVCVDLNNGEQQQHHETWCRYSDLLALAEEIQQAGLLAASNAPFPAKTFWQASGVADDVMEARTRELDAYFSGLLENNPQAEETPLLKLPGFRRLLLSEDAHGNAGVHLRHHQSRLVHIARTFLKENAELGEGEGWALMDHARRVYTRRQSDGNEYKQVLQLTTAGSKGNLEGILDRIQVERAQWDYGFRGEQLLGTSTLDNGQVILRKRVFHQASTTYGLPHEAEVIQTVLGGGEEDGYRHYWVEVTIDLEQTALEGFVHDRIKASGFVLQAEQGGQLLAATYISKASNNRFVPIDWK